MAQLEQIWTIFDLLTQGSDDSAGAYLNQVLDHSLEWFGAGGGSVFLLNETTGEYLPAAKAGDLARIPWDAVIRVGEGIAGSAISKQKPLLINDPDKEKIYNRTTELSSSMVVPLVTRQETVVGVLCLSRQADRGAFTQDDLKKAQSLGGYIALAVSNARMLKQHQEVQRIKRMAEIGQMTASIAHEIRNPLTGIKSAAQVIQQNPELAAEFAEIIEQEAVKLNSLCDEFLAFAKPISLSPRPYQLSKLALHVCQLHQADFEAKRVTLVTSIASDEVEVDIDGPRVEQVIRNLILNALQACQPGGKVKVSVSRNGNLTVEDTGNGMDSATVSKLFSPFFTTKSNGTGLGLSMAKKIMDAHEGQIVVTSEPERGTVFQLQFRPDSAA